MYGLTDPIAGLSQTPSLGYPPGYLTNANIGANQYLFFLPGFFDPGALLVAENTKQPVTVGELLTLGSAPMLNAYAGPVLSITGCKSSHGSFCSDHKTLTSSQQTTYRSAEVTALQLATHLSPQFRPH